MSGTNIRSAGLLVLTLPSGDMEDRLGGPFQISTEKDFEGGSGRAKSIISCTTLPAAVKWSPSQTWTTEASRVFRRDTTKRETITGINLEGLGWPPTQPEWWNTYTMIEIGGTKEG